MLLATSTNRIYRIAYVALLAIAIGHHVNGQHRIPLLSDNNGFHTEYVDKNNVTILAMFNLTTAEMNRKLSNTQASSQSDGDIINEPRNEDYFDKIKEHRLNDIRNRLESAFQVGKSEESEQSMHEMAAYPICGHFDGTETNESSWLRDNNVTIRFSDSLFEAKSDHLNLDSAILRLYKLDPNARNQSQSSSEPTANTKTKRCGEPMLDSQVRVTVSIVQQMRRNKRERKKRICNTIMMNVSKTGWVEIDIKRAIYIWENVEQQSSRAQSHQGRNLIGWLMIEVHDEEERPLKPGLFFSPPICDQADLAIPWNYYGPHAALSTSATDQVPKCPRLDVTLSGYATWAAATKTHSNHLQKKLPRSIHQPLTHIESTNSRPINPATIAAGVGVAVDAATVATTATLRSYKRKRHSQRSPQPIAHYVDSSKANSNHA